jgi:leukotriene-A4 hydrolase
MRASAARFQEVQLVFRARSRALPPRRAMPPAPAAAAVEAPPAADPCSLANPAEAWATHLDLEIDVDFDSQTLRCWARQRVERAAPGGCLVLDSRALALDGPARVGGADADAARGPASAALGEALSIALPPGVGAIDVELRWSAPPGAVAAQWLAPAQTAGGKLPFFFTQCQAIHAR